jgi:hypothetical protein
MTKISGWAGTDKSAATAIRPPLPRGTPEPARHRRGFDTGAPDHIGRFDAVTLCHNPISVDRLDRRIEQHFDPHPLEGIWRARPTE